MTKRDTRRTHKRVAYERGPASFYEIVGERDDPNCNGTGKQSRFGVFTQTPCRMCNGSGKWPIREPFTTQGPSELVITSACSNTGYTSDPKLADDWKDVDCPACLNLVWLSSPASHAKVRDHHRVTDAVAIIVPVKHCGRVYMYLQKDEPHVWASVGDGIAYCNGTHKRFERNH